MRMYNGNNQVYNAYIFGFLLDTLKRRVYVQLYCYPTSFPHSPRHIRGIYHIVGRAFYSLLTEVRVTRHQRSCHACFQLTIIFKSVVANSLYVCFGAGNRWQSLGEKNSLMSSRNVVSLDTKLYSTQTYFLTDSRTNLQ